MRLLANKIYMMSFGCAILGTGGGGDLDKGIELLIKI